MNKYLPFIFPLVASVIVLFLAMRWFSMQTDRPGEINEGVQIEDLTAAEEDTILRGAGDFKQTDLQGEEAQGDVRYEIADERVRFSVMADLPEPEAPAFYQVWIISNDTLSKAFRLEVSKGGYAGTAAVAQGALPFQVVVTQEQTDDAQMETEIMRGTISE